MIRFFRYNKQIILNTILFIALILALVLREESGLRDFFLGFATSVAFINFINSFGNTAKSKHQESFSRD